MSRSKFEILRDLDPHNPLSVQALIDFHKVAFGGWKMVDGEVQTGTDPAQQGADGQQGPPQGNPDGAPADKPDDKLGDPGLKALQSERDARKALEAQLTQLRTGLAAALGVEAKDAKSSTDDIVASLQEQMAALNHSNLVLSVANENQITDKDDLELLRSIKDEAALRKLAGRIKPAEKAADPAKPRTPSPDRSQARGDRGDVKAGDAGRAEAARRFKAATQK